MAWRLASGLISAVVAEVVRTFAGAAEIWLLYVKSGRTIARYIWLFLERRSRGHYYKSVV